MCDSAVIVPDAGAVWLIKNSDREPSESQAVEHHPAAAHRPGTRLACTHVEILQAAATHAVTISRPTWMWGCEMGVNEHGLALANEAVFTRMPIAPTGLTGMDLQRLALERCRGADEAVELIVELLARHAQGGRMAHTGSLRYHSSFLIADAGGAWVLETAGPLWAAQRVRGRRSISNALSIEDDFDRIHPDALDVARGRGWCSSSRDFGFARCFSRRLLTLAAGARARADRARACADRSALEPAALAEVLRDHAGASPADGLRMRMPCAHASWLPTRRAGQTTASMIAQLAPAGARVWMTGTSSPCLSVFKPVPVALGRAWAERPPARADRDSLWWRHERLHRIVLRNWTARHRVAEAERAALEARAFATGTSSAGTSSAGTSFVQIWDDHRAALPGWIEQARACGRDRPGPFTSYWRRQSRRDDLREISG